MTDRYPTFEELLAEKQDAFSSVEEASAWLESLDDREDWISAYCAEFDVPDADLDIDGSSETSCRGSSGDKDSIEDYEIEQEIVDEFVLEFDSSV